MENFYELLGTSLTASFEEIKFGYKRCIFMLHPDKSGLNYDKEVLHRVQLAWETLKNSEKRKEYDDRLCTQQRELQSCVYDEVDIGEFSLSTDADKAEYRLTCRCSGSFIIDETDLLAGFNLVSCTTCSARTLIKR